MATYGAGLKIAANVNLTGTNQTYTVPAGGYAIVQWWVDSSGTPTGTATVTINGWAALSVTNGAPYPSAPMHLGPGSTINVNAGTNQVQIFGIQFTN